MSSGRGNGVKARRSVQHLAVIQPNVAGIDLAAEEHWVCGPATEDGKPNVQRFGTRTYELEALGDWLKAQGVESVAMESTGVYWIPVYEILESRGMQVLLVNARQLSHVPGRKTDMQDCQWLQLLHSCGLLRGSFRPKDTICRLRALHRQYANLVAERSRAIQWMQKALDQMNIQVHRAVSDLNGKTGLAILRDIVSGERDPMRLAQHRDYHCRKSVAEIATYLRGNWREEHLFNLKMALALYDRIAEMLCDYEVELARQMEALQPPDRREESVPAHPNPTKERVIRSRGEQDLRTSLWRFAGVDMTRIDGLRPDACRLILTEIGPDLSAFPSEKHFVSWLRLSPRIAISGGKVLARRRNATGATRVAGILRMAAMAVGKSKTALGSYYRRLARRKGADVAVFATARRLAILIYRMLRFGQDYIDEGMEAYEARFEAQRLHNLHSVAKQLGYQLVPLETAP